MSKTKIHFNRVAGFCSAIVLIVLLVIVNITIASGLIPGLSPDIDESQSQLIRRESMNVCVEGQFVDRNSQAITLPGGPGQIAQIIEDECYSFLIGYRTTTKKLSGLRKQLLTYLFFGGEDGVGAQVGLTTDNGLQAFCYETLGQKEGSVIVGATSGSKDRSEEALRSRVANRCQSMISGGSLEILVFDTSSRNMDLSPLQFTVPGAKTSHIHMEQIPEVLKNIASSAAVPQKGNAEPYILGIFPQGE